MEKTINERLVLVQSVLKAPKDMNNDFGHYRYRSCESILEELKPHLSKNGLLLLLTDDIVVIGARTYVKASAILRDMEGANPEQLIVTAFAREEEVKKGMDSSQITGAASSYARKYALNGMFLIDDTRDSDVTNKGQDHEERIERKARAQKAEESQSQTEAHQETKPPIPSNMETVLINDVTKSTSSGLYSIKCANRVFITNKEVLALIARGFKGKQCIVEYTVDTDMQAVLLNITAVHA